MAGKWTARIPDEVARASELIQEQIDKANGADDGRREAFIEAQALLLRAVLETSGGR